MSKYTEAIEIIYKVDDYISNWFGGYPYTDEEQEMLDALEPAIEALQIADRLEQADAELHDTILYDLERRVLKISSAMQMKKGDQNDKRIHS